MDIGGIRHSAINSDKLISLVKIDVVVPDIKHYLEK